MLYQEVQMKDFIVYDVTEKYVDEWDNFEGTFAPSSTVEIYETNINIKYKEKEYILSIRSDTTGLSTYDYIYEKEAKGMTTEILAFLIKELTNEEKSCLSDFLNDLHETITSNRDLYLHNLYLFEDSLNLKIPFTESLGNDLVEKLQ